MRETEKDQLFAAWLKRFWPLVVRIAKAYTTRREDQDDLAQEILLQLWRSIPRFRGDAGETTWVYRVSLNTAMAWLRGHVRRRKRLPIALVDPDRLEARDLPEIGDGIVRELYRAIRQLGPADSSVILMHLDGLSYDQMAEVLDITPNNVGVRIHRVRAKLAALMKGLADDI
jgi:RNA polymerase sigma-70 factor (ECF subfamily)